MRSLNQSQSAEVRKQKYGGDWRKRRKAVVEAAGHACQQCGRSERLEVHHKFHSNELEVLCNRCHARQRRN